jgi:hypothetical protein
MKFVAYLFGIILIVVAIYFLVPADSTAELFRS